MPTGQQEKPTIAVTLGDPRGIGPEVVRAALADSGLRDAAHFIILGPEGPVPELSPEAWSEIDSVVRFEPVGPWRDDGRVRAGALSVAAIERGVALALSGEADGLVTGPISKAALRAAGCTYPGHTELLRDRCAVPDVTMVMAAETTPLGGPLRVALLTVHMPLREALDMLSVELVVRRASIAGRALRDWWGIPTPRLALAGVNPHASERGLFGDEEERILEPAAERLRDLGELEITGIFPADTVFRRCLEGEVDAVVVPYHDVGLAVVKTLAGESGVNVTTGLPFPRTSPDHGTALDIAGRGIADSSSMEAALARCIAFCRSAAGR